MRITSVIVLTLGAALIVGYALLSNPAPGHAAAITSSVAPSAQSEPGFAGGSRAAASGAGSTEQVSREPAEFADGSQSSRFDAGIKAGHPAQAGAASAQWTQSGAQSGSQATQIAEPDSASARSIQPLAPGSRAQPLATGLSAAAVAPPASHSVPVPLAFSPQAAAAAASNPQLASGLQTLQQNFVNALGGPNQDPNDPTYYQRWLSARELSDEQYKILVGNQNYLMQQISLNGP
jgi:hypothetical protein